MPVPVDHSAEKDCIEATAHIALGSNLGDRAVALKRAVTMLNDHSAVTVLAVSRAIETQPVGPPGQGPYLNAAATLRTHLSPRALLAEMLRIERSLGRDRTRESRFGPRHLDLDLLLYGQRMIDEPGLTVPHPRMHDRPFVLEPLAEIAPDAWHPAMGATVGELLARIQAAVNETGLVS